MSIFRVFFKGDVEQDARDPLEAAAIVNHELSRVLSRGAFGIVRPFKLSGPMVMTKEEYDRTTAEEFGRMVKGGG